MAQFQVAVALQPNDSETHKALMACYDKLKDKQAAIDQLFSLVQLDRRNIELYADLAQRLAPDQKAQERAHCAIVEMKPHEADSHTRLAQIRQSQDRWKDAIVH